jgi:hypothetical protein
MQSLSAGTGQALSNVNGSASHEYSTQREYRRDQQSARLQEYGHPVKSDYKPITRYSTRLAPPRTSSPFGRISSRFRGLWLWELIASVFSVACMAAVIGVLLYEQGKPLDQWEQGLGRNIPPTAVVSVLGTMGKTSCIVAVAEIISQLKWVHFKTKSQKLIDLQLFDDASRGPWGAFMLVVTKNKTTLLAGCASLIMIAALLMEPFIQLVFSFPSRLTTVTGALVPIYASQVYDPSSLPSRWGLCYGSSAIPSIMQAAILSPLWNKARGPDLSCTFERCEWPTITTLGMCSSCSDLTTTVVSQCSVNQIPVRPGIQCNYTIPSTNETFITRFDVSGGASVQRFYQPLWSSRAEKYLDGDFMDRPTVAKPARISQFSFISFAPDIPWRTYLDFSDSNNTVLTQSPAVDKAMQCTFDMCARTFTKPYYGNFSAGKLAGPAMPLQVTNATSQSSGPILVELGPATADPTTMNTTFRVNYCDYSDLTRYLGELFNAEHYSAGMYGPDSAAWAGALTPVKPITPNIGPALSAADDLPALLQEVADSMTEVFRTSPNSTAYNGIGMKSVTYISVTWIWLLLPIAIVILTFVILVVVIIQTRLRGIPTWKSSSLALLFHELEGWDQSEREFSGPNDIPKQVTAMRVRSLYKDGVPVFLKYPL